MHTNHLLSIIALAMAPLLFGLSACDDQLLPPDTGGSNPPSPNPRIYYTDSSGMFEFGEPSIVTVAFDGTDRRLLGRGTLGTSPRGDLVAFVSVSTGTPLVYTVRRDGTGLRPRPVTIPPASEIQRCLALSPDGTTVAVVTYEYNGASKPILHMVVDGPSGNWSTPIGSAEYLPVPLITPRFSPDGRKVAVLYSAESTPVVGLLTVDVATGAVDTLTPTFDPMAENIGEGFDWSPDGRQIVYVQGMYAATVSVVDVTTHEIDTILNDETPRSWPRWLPDGSQIAYIAYSEYGSDVYTVDLSGSIRRLTFSPMKGEIALDVAPDGSALLIGSIDPYSGYNGYFTGEVLDLRVTSTPRTVAPAAGVILWGR